MKTSSRKLTGAKNIGPTIERRLNDIGIFSLDDLEKLGPAVAYQKICLQNPDKTFPVCYYLYSLQGALLNMHWDDLSTKLKTKLLKEIGR